MKNEGLTHRFAQYEAPPSLYLPLPGPAAGTQAGAVPWIPLRGSGNPFPTYDPGFHLSKLGIRGYVPPLSPHLL